MVNMHLQKMPSLGQWLWALRTSKHIRFDWQGFVSNKDSEKGEGKGDPVEEVLYGVFVATSARASVGELATILSVETGRVQAAVSFACRLGFATRLSPGLFSVW